MIAGMPGGRLVLEAALAEPLGLSSKPLDLGLSPLLKVSDGCHCPRYVDPSRDSALCTATGAFGRGCAVPVNAEAAFAMLADLLTVRL